MGVARVVDTVGTSSVEGVVISGSLLSKNNGKVDRSGFGVMGYDNLIDHRYLKSSRKVILWADGWNGLYFLKNCRFLVVIHP